MVYMGSKGTAFLVAGALLVSGCEAARSVVGLEKQAPDEFAVVTRAPLSVPPDFGLRPPTPGAQRPQEKSVRNQARDVLLKDARKNTTGATGAADTAQVAVASGRVSAGEAALLASAGALNADGSIRSVVNRETTALVDSQDSFFDKVFFWQEVDPPGTIVDPDKESRRLREASAIGDPPNKGEVPVIKRRHRGILEGIF
jgi:hypothetical protein